MSKRYLVVIALSVLGAGCGGNVKVRPDFAEEPPPPDMTVFFPDDIGSIDPGKVEDLRNQAARVSSQAEAAARRGMEAVRDGSQQLRERAQRATDQTVAYVKDEPIKSMLIAAATGAVLMALVSLMGRSRND